MRRHVSCVRLLRALSCCALGPAGLAVIGERVFHAFERTLLCAIRSTLQRSTLEVLSLRSDRSVGGAMRTFVRERVFSVSGSSLARSVVRRPRVRPGVIGSLGLVLLLRCDECMRALHLASL